MSWDRSYQLTTANEQKRILPVFICDSCNVTYIIHPETEKYVAVSPMDENFHIVDYY